MKTPIDKLNDLHKLLAKSEISAKTYQKASSILLELKRDSIMQYSKDEVIKLLWDGKENGDYDDAAFEEWIKKVI